MPGPIARLSLPFAAWPKIDQRVWERAAKSDDPFRDGGGARLAPSTLHIRWMAWRRFLGFLTLDEPDALKLSPAARLTPERIRLYARHLALGNTAHSVAIQIDALYGAARLMISRKDFSWLREIKRRLYQAAPHGNRRQTIVTSSRLEKLGFDLMKESSVSIDRPFTPRQALAYRDGLIIALMAHIFLRHKNYVELELGRNIFEEGGRWWVVIPPSDTKTHSPIEFELPPEIQSRLVLYLTVVRPRLLRRPDCNMLWASAKSGPLSYSALGPVFVRHTEARLGVRVTPHQARDAGATSLAIFRPEQVGMASDLLGHTSSRTTHKYYIRARGVEASRAQAQVIRDLRKQSK